MNSNLHDILCSSMFYFKQQHERDMNPVSYCKQFHYKKKEIMSASGAFHSSIPTLVLHWQHFNKTNKEKLTFGQHCTNKDTRKENVFNIQECFDFKMRSTHQKCNIKMISINNNKHDLKKKKSNQQLWELFWEQRNRTRTSKFLTNSLDALSPEGGRKG